MIRAFEGGHVATTEAALGEYVKALALVDRLDNTALLQTLSVRLWTFLSHCTVVPLSGLPSPPNPACLHLAAAGVCSLRNLDTHAGYEQPVCTLHATGTVGSETVETGREQDGRASRSQIPPSPTVMQRGAQAMRSRGGSAGSFASSPYAGGAQAAEGGGLRIGSLGAAAVDLGTAKNPVHMMQVKRRTLTQPIPLLRRRTEPAQCTRLFDANRPFQGGTLAY